MMRSICLIWIGWTKGEEDRDLAICENNHDPGELYDLKADPGV